MGEFLGDPWDSLLADYKVLELEQSFGDDTVTGGFSAYLAQNYPDVDPTWRAALACGQANKDSLDSMRGAATAGVGLDGHDTLSAVLGPAEGYPSPEVVEAFDSFSSGLNDLVRPYFDAFRERLDGAGDAEGGDSDLAAVVWNVNVQNLTNLVYDRRVGDVETVDVLESDEFICIGDGHPSALVDAGAMRQATLSFKRNRFSPNEFDTTATRRAAVGEVVAAFLALGRDYYDYSDASRAVVPR